MIRGSQRERERERKKRGRGKSDGITGPILQN